MAMNPFVVEEGNENPFASSDNTAANPWGSSDKPAASTSRWGKKADLAPAPPATPSPAASHNRGGSNAPNATASGSGRYKSASNNDYSTSNSNTTTDGGGMTRELELQRREADVAQREARLRDRERAVGTFNPPNWPKCRPMIYHDIEKEIPVRGRWLVKRIYLAWMLAVIVYLVNSIAAFSLLVTGAASGGVTFGISLVILLVGTPVSFVFWYRPLYNGVRAESSASFFFFWFNYGAHLCVAVLLAVGIPGWGGAGVIITLAQFKVNVPSAIICLISSALLIFEVIFGTWQIKSASMYFRSRGMTAEKAKEEAVVGFASSQAGRDLAGAAVKSAAATELKRYGN
ncbi:scamp family-domain-containing protein [Powellomyces hirtus]|nr:scamp family-domain-containing protein [Powellomyces hirtus]